LLWAVKFAEARKRIDALPMHHPAECLIMVGCRLQESYVLANQPETENQLHAGYV
jgi:hypothetical protein